MVGVTVLIVVSGLRCCFGLRVVVIVGLISSGGMVVVGLISSGGFLVLCGVLGFGWF